MQQVRDSATSNTTPGSTTVVVSAAIGNAWLRPLDQAEFFISDAAEFPEIVFEFRSSAPGPYRWAWTIEWGAKVSGLRERERKGEVLKTFTESGSFESHATTWTADLSGKVLGGTLVVTVTAGQHRLRRTVLIKGTNPSKESIATYVATLEDMDGMEKLLEQETRSKHFIALDRLPIVAFDQGYGITQMTNPAPDYEQTWNWKANILAGSAIYQEKVRAARKFLGGSERTYTNEQLQREVFSRWNGGTYHEWDATESAWVRKKNILCDSNTGNIGWFTDDAKNQDKTEAELHERDKDTYKKGGKGQSAEHRWKYSGVCYADHVLSE
ncbi:hypothetical protein ACIP1T_28560 [Pseudomonas japonica]|uniref:hypothetical protein n=1 Tax=Pseudomonas japonica TaxID=256466 RepID=UPI00382C4779